MNAQVRLDKCIVTDENGNQDIKRGSGHNHIRNWLFLAVQVFYLNVVGQVIFLILSRIISFRTLRERATLGAYFRYRSDFLDYVKDDIHWFIIYVTEILLAIICVYLRKGSTETNNWFYFVLAAKYLFQGTIIFYVFFTKGTVS